MTKSFDVDLLRTLTSIPAVSGHEDRMIGYLKHRLEGLSDEVQVDGIGNVTARFGKPQGGPKVLLFAHMDQLGLCVKRLGEDGFLRVDRIGGVNRKALVARPVVIHASSGRDLPGTIGVMAHHLTPDAQRFTVPDIPELYVDVGANSKDELLEMGIRVGDSITFENPFAILNERHVRAGALDNRIGVYILLKVVEALKDKALGCTLYASCTVQEEFNVRGSDPVARNLKPDVAICIDITVPGDTPDLRHVNDVRMGGGPTIRLMSFHGRGTLGGLIPNPKLVAHVERAAEALDIPLQREASIGGLTDASFLQLLNNGIPAVDVGVPARYTHSPVEMVNMHDVVQAIELLAEAIRRLDETSDFSRGVPWQS
jgi:putative aminopeptidase FrvX